MKPCYCINPRCRQPDHPDNNNPTSRYCYSCGSELLLHGKYRVSRLLSDDSGFGIVYEIFEGFEPKILKVLQRRWNKQPKAVELFKREYEVLLTLTQENIKGIPQAKDFFRVSTQGREQFILFGDGKSRWDGFGKMGTKKTIKLPKNRQ